MDKGRVLKRKRNLSIPWFEQIEKTVIMPHDTKRKTFYSIKPPDYVTALTQTTENKFIIVKQFRPVVEDYTLELPSGHVEAGEKPLQAVIRELGEETGCNAGEVVPLGKITPDTGRLENFLWAFYVNNVELTNLPDPAQNEGIEVLLITRRELYDLIREGRLNHALDMSVIALALIHNYLKL